MVIRALVPSQERLRSFEELYTRKLHTGFLSLYIDANGLQRFCFHFIQYETVEICSDAGTALVPSSLPGGSLHVSRSLLGTVNKSNPHTRVRQESTRTSQYPQLRDLVHELNKHLLCCQTNFS